MTKLTRRLMLPSLLLGCVVSLTAQDTKNLFVGKWTLNASKSKFEMQPGYKSETVTITNDKVAAEGVDGNGKSFSWSYQPKSGAAVPIEGMDNSTVVEKLSGKTVDHTWKLGGSELTGHGVIAKDGKTLIYRQTGKNADGKTVSDRFFFERQ